MLRGGGPCVKRATSNNSGCVVVFGEVGSETYPAGALFPYGAPGAKIYVRVKPGSPTIPVGSLLAADTSSADGQLGSGHPGHPRKRDGFRKASTHPT